MAIPAWLEGAASGFGYAPGSRSQEDLITDPRRAIPEGRRRRMGAFPALSDWQAETAQRDAHVTGMDPSLPNAPTMDFDTFSGRPAGTAMDEDMPVRSVGASLPRLPDASSFPTEYQDDPRAVAHNMRIRELTVPGRLYSPAEQDAIQKAALGSVDSEVGGKAQAAQEHSKLMREKLAGDREFRDRQQKERERENESRDKARDKGLEIRGDMVQLRTQGMNFNQSMVVHQQAYKEAHDRFEDWAKETGLDLQQKEQAEKVFDNRFKEQLALSGIVPGAHSSLLGFSRWLQGKPGVQQEAMGDVGITPLPPSGVEAPAAPPQIPPLPPVPSPGVTQLRAPASSGAPAGGIPIYRARFPDAQNGAAPEAEGNRQPITGNNEAAVMRRFNLTVEQARDLLKDADAGVQRAKDILAGKVPLKGRR